MPEEFDLQPFKIIYEANKDKPMEFIQKEMLAAKAAILKTAIEAQHISFDEPLKQLPTSTDNVSDIKKLTAKDLIIDKNDGTITENHIQCRICAKKFKTLKRHLKAKHNFTEAEYIKLCKYPEETKLMSKKYEKESKKRAVHARGDEDNNEKTNNESINTQESNNTEQSNAK